MRSRTDDFVEDVAATLSAGIDWIDIHGRQLFGRIDHPRNIDLFPTIIRLFNRAGTLVRRARYGI